MTDAISPTNVAHTPGPWRLTPYSSIVGRGVVANGGIVIATIHGDPHPSAEANARLIATAPELLEALRELLASQLTQMPSYEAGKDAQDAWADRRANARNNAAAAIAKSEGRT